MNYKDFLNIPTRAENEEARESAIDEHYKSDWIDDLDEEDAKTLIRQVWSVVNENNTRPEIKYFAMKSPLHVKAEKLSNLWADENWGDFLKTDR